MLSNPNFEIGGVPVGPAHPPFVIAEMSGNHNQSLERALAIVDAAADAGAHAIKLQTYTADSITLDVRHGEFFVSDPDNLWAGRSLHNLYQQAHTPREWHAPIFRRARDRGLVCFSSPFDEEAVDFLQSLDAPAFKIASFENTHLPLIRKAASTGKPLIMSTGMATLGELEEAVATARAAGCRDLVLLKCTSTYPASPSTTHVRTIPHMRQLFDVAVGLSDHTMGVGVAVAAVAMGACVVEKHFTLNRADGGVDSSFSLEPAELRLLVEETRRAWDGLGSIHYGPTEAEKKSLAYRRSLYVGADMQAGDMFDTTNLRIVRPGKGLAPRHFDQLLGRRVRRAVTKGTAVSWDLVD
ncbi:MAG: pseudaminic acid synthase [Burkholderiales bacterium]|nr:pseudaminic acid synthase [Burkholderiales bacterium]